MWELDTTGRPHLSASIAGAVAASSGISVITPVAVLAPEPSSISFCDGLSQDDSVLAAEADDDHADDFELRSAPPTPPSGALVGISLAEAGLMFGVPLATSGMSGHDSGVDGGVWSTGGPFGGL